jgi:hypothetical protein
MVPGMSFFRAMAEIAASVVITLAYCFAGLMIGAACMGIGMLATHQLG